jgi:hypothetical protein
VEEVNERLRDLDERAPARTTASQYTRRGAWWGTGGGGGGGGGGTSNHNLLSNRQGGTVPDQYYHLPFQEHQDLVDANAQLGDLHTDQAPTFDGITYGEADWADGNVVYVPLDGDIQTYVNAATAGDTLILASGVYTITSTITINKQLNIVGQGSSGFVTAPVTPSHGTLITSSTASVTALQIDSDNVRLAYLSLNLSGAASKGINTAKDLEGLVFTNIDIIVSCTGAAQGASIWSSDVVMRDLTFNVTSSDASASGVLFYNTSTSTRGAVVDCWNVTGTVSGAATYGYAFACWNNNVAQTLELNLSNSVCKATGASGLEVAAASYSTTTNNSVINAYLCTLDGVTWDAYQTGTNELNLGGSVLVNDLVSGTVTYRATMTSGSVNVNNTGLHILDTNGSHDLIIAPGSDLTADRTLPTGRSRSRGTRRWRIGSIRR